MIAIFIACYERTEPEKQQYWAPEVCYLAFVYWT